MTEDILRYQKIFLPKEQQKKKRKKSIVVNNTEKNENKKNKTDILNTNDWDWSIGDKVGDDEKADSDDENLGGDTGSGWDDDLVSKLTTNPKKSTTTTNTTASTKMSLSKPKDSTTASSKSSTTSTSANSTKKSSSGALPMSLSFFSSSSLDTNTFGAGDWDSFTSDLAGTLDTSAALGEDIDLESLDFGGPKKPNPRASITSKSDTSPISPTDPSPTATTTRKPSSTSLTLKSSPTKVKPKPNVIRKSSVGSNSSDSEQNMTAVSTKKPGMTGTAVAKKPKSKITAQAVEEETGGTKGKEGWDDW